MTDLLPATIRAVVARYPAIVPMLSRHAKILYGIKAELGNINMRYHDEITRALIAYFEGGPIAASRNAFKRAMIQAFGDAFDAGWIDGGGTLPVDDDALEWIGARMNEEAGYIDALFQDARQRRKDKDFDWFAWASRKADRYTAAVTGVYNAGRMLAGNKQMLTWHLGATGEHCVTCVKLNGQRHRAEWYVKRNYIPGKAGAAMYCGGYNCQCFLTDDNGLGVTI